MVAHLLDLSVMVPDPSIQLLHEQAMLLTIVHWPEDQQEEKKEKTAGLIGSQNILFIYFQSHLSHFKF